MNLFVLINFLGGVGQVLTAAADDQASGSVVTGWVGTAGGLPWTYGVSGSTLPAVAALMSSIKPYYPYARSCSTQYSSAKPGEMSSFPDALSA
jgi:hypothetical protein